MKFAHNCIWKVQEAGSRGGAVDKVQGGRESSAPYGKAGQKPGSGVSLGYSRRFLVSGKGKRQDPSLRSLAGHCGLPGRHGRMSTLGWAWRNIFSHPESEQLRKWCSGESLFKHEVQSSVPGFASARVML